MKHDPDFLLDLLEAVHLIAVALTLLIILIFLVLSSSKNPSLGNFASLSSSSPFLVFAAGE